jgi:putative transposase
MQSRMDTEPVLSALRMVIWRRKPSGSVTVHSDQGGQFFSYELQGFLKERNLVASMSRRGNCHDNVVAASFFQLRKRERVRRIIYANHDEARQDIFNYIELFHIPVRLHSLNDGLSPVKYEMQFN